MNRFSAEKFFAMGQVLGSLELILKPQVMGEEGTAIYLKAWLENIEDHGTALGLIQSKKCARRFIKLLGGTPTKDQIASNIRHITELIHSEMEEHLFLSVPSHRSEWYSKDAEAILGLECCQRFSGVQREIEQAAICYALGQYTASAFHLCRSTEAGLKAISKAINFVPANDNWTLVFRELGRQFKLDPKLRPAPWPTHEKFLDLVWGDLKAVSKAWRNDICHLVDSYSEPEAKEMLTVIPMFLREIATQMDENGKLY